MKPANALALSMAALCSACSVTPKVVQTQPPILVPDELMKPTTLSFPNFLELAKTSSEASSRLNQITNSLRNRLSDSKPASDSLTTSAPHGTAVGK